MLSIESIKALKRLKEEFKDICSNSMTAMSPNVSLINENNIFEWGITLFGPKDTPYIKGIFDLKVIFKKNYPISAPIIYFITPIYHVDVNPYKSDFEPLGFPAIEKLFYWKPEYTMREIILDLFSLFYVASGKHPYGLDRNEEFRKNKELYKKKIEFFTKKYAYPTEKINKDKFIPSEKS